MAPLGFSPQLAAQQTARVLPDQAYVCPRVEERTTQGGTTYEWPRPDGAEPVPCGLAPKGGGEYLGRGGRAQKESAADRIDERREDVMLVPAGTAVTQHDRLEVVDGETYEVILVPERSIELLLELEVREVTD
jgi:hypothetical protein